MVLVRKMIVEDAEFSAKVSVETMSDMWNRFEKDYYPKKALDFDSALTLYFKVGFVPKAYLHKELCGIDFIKMSKWRK
ncbi:MAG: hypothetical protein QXI91_04575 [Candidatus Bathyarchaeia archaeon]